jgi:hypothetical protein
MAFYPKKTGADSFTPAKIRKDDVCFICSEDIKKGSIRYKSSGPFSLCTLCYNAWLSEGVILGKISRSKRAIKNE